MKLSLKQHHYYVVLLCDVLMDAETHNKSLKSFIYNNDTETTTLWKIHTNFHGIRVQNILSDVRRCGNF